MKVGASSFGYGEIDLLNAASVEIRKGLGLPTGSNGLTTDSHLCDVQAGWEKVMTEYLSIISGADIVSGLGCLAADATASLTQLVVDDDVFGQMRHVVREFSASADDLCEEAIARVGPQAHFLVDEHTLPHFRRTQYHSKTAARGSYESWRQRGFKKAIDLAVERLQSLIAEPCTEYVTSQVGADLAKVIQEAERGLV